MSNPLYLLRVSSGLNLKIKAAGQQEKKTLECNHHYLVCLNIILRALTIIYLQDSGTSAAAKRSMQGIFWFQDNS